MTLDAELVDSFLEEARGYLDRIREELAPALSGQPMSARNLGRLSDTVHSLKGVSGLLGFTHLHQLVARLERALKELATGRGSRAGLAPEVASAAVQSIDRMLANIEAGTPEKNEELLLEFESGLEIYAAVRAHDATGGGLVEAEALADSLAAETDEVVDTLLADFEAARSDARPGPRQRVAARGEDTLRGLCATAAMAGRPDLSDVLEALADLLRDVAAGRRTPDDGTLETIGRLLQDVRTLAATPTGAEEAVHTATSLLEEIKGPSGTERAPSPDDATLDEEMLAELREVFAEEARDHLASARAALKRLEHSPDDGEAINALFRATHTLKGAAGTVGLDQVMEAAHQLEDFFAGVKERGGPVDREAIDVVRGGLSQIEALVDGRPGTSNTAPLDAVAEASGESTGPAPKSVRVPIERIDSLLLETGDLLASRARLEELSSRLRLLVERIGQRARQLSERVDDFATRHAYSPPCPPPSAVTTGGGGAGMGTEIWGGLLFDRYDEVNVFAREVVELEFQLRQTVADLDRLTGGLEEEVEEIDRHTQSLRKTLTRARFVPINRLFERFVGPAGDWARQQGKEVDLIVEPSAAELDRAVVDAVAEPLVHLVRNAVTHGIESPEERVRLGKPRRGCITLRAHQLGRDVVVEVADDGRGLDPPALREAAVARGILSREEAERTPDAQIIDVIFAPGFSTRTRADEMAGRGVGLDVVATAVAELGGVMSVSHRPRRGTVFSARIPATQAILEVLAVEAGSQTFALPHTAVRESLLIDRREAKAAVEGGRIYWRGEPLRALSLSALIGEVRPHASRRIPAVVVGHGERNCALIVDRLVGREEGIVRSLGPLLRTLGLYAGAVVGAEGQVRLVLDAAWLLTASMGALPRRTPESRGSRTQPRLLVVDDSLSVRKHLSRLLRGAGYDVTVASDGQAALEELLVAPFDLVLTDLEMPRVHGFDLIDRIRAEPHLRSLPVVVLSSRAGRKHRARAEALGANAFLSKPVDRRDLLRTLARCLDHSGGSRSK